jgi:hypothetical protein
MSDEHDDQRLATAGEIMAGRALLHDARQLIRTKKSTFYTEQWSQYPGLRFRPADYGLLVADEILEGFRIGLEWVEAGFAGPGLTPRTVAWAMVLADGGAIAPWRAREAVGWFARHEVDLDAPGADVMDDDYPSPGRVAWELWGSDEGRAWLVDLVDDMDEVDENGSWL